MTHADAPVLLTKTGPVAEIRFNRPDRLNALGVALANGFADAVDAVLEDADVRVIILSSEGRAFMAGGDLKHLNDAADKAAAARELIDPVHRALKKLAQAPQITLASIKGAAAGAGMSLALGADLAIAADDAVFNMAYARVAAPPDCGGSWALPRLVGTRKALEIALLSDAINAADALRLGLVNRVVPAADLDREVAALAARLAAGAPIALGRTKALIRQSLETPLGAQLDAERESFAACAMTADFSEALSAFLGKRKPVFEGR